MKKIFALAIAAASIFTVQAQDAKALYEQAKKLDDAFNKAKPTQMNPEGKLDADLSKGLLDAIDIYGQVLGLDQKPNEKGQVKPKFTKKIQSSMTQHAIDGDYSKAAVLLYNAGRQYPEAYNAFMLSGMSSKQLNIPDSIYSVDFYNAGNSAYGKDFKAAAAAYDAARAANSNEINVYVYSIGARQNLAQQDTVYAKQATKEISDIAKEGLERFGYDQDFLLNNYLQYFFENNDFDKALNELEKVAQLNPNNANVYRLRGMISNAKHDYLQSIPSFVKMSELTDNYGYLLAAAGDLNSIGKAIMGRITNPTPEDKAQILDIFNSALKIAKKAQSTAEADQRIANEIDDIEYNIENANKL